MIELVFVLLGSALCAVGIIEIASRRGVPAAIELVLLRDAMLGRRALRRIHAEVRLLDWLAKRIAVAWHTWGDWRIARRTHLQVLLMRHEQDVYARARNLGMFASPDMLGWRRSRLLLLGGARQHLVSWLHDGWFLVAPEWMDWDTAKDAGALCCTEETALRMAVEWIEAGCPEWLPRERREPGRPWILRVADGVAVPEVPRGN